MYISFFHYLIEINLIVLKKLNALIFLFLENIFNSVRNIFMFFKIRIIQVDILLFHAQVYFCENRLRNLIFDFTFFYFAQKHALLLIAAKLWKNFYQAVIGWCFLYFFYQFDQELLPVLLAFEKLFLFLLIFVKFDNLLL